MPRKPLMLLAVATATASLSAFAFGGWAVITLDELPTHFNVGKPVTLTFVVRQHGVTPMNDVKPTVEARLGSPITGATVQGSITRASGAGQYAASFTLPKSGEWRVTVKSGWGNSNVTLDPIQAVEAGKTVAMIADAERGKQLFVAKGCVSCHVNERVEAKGIAADVGPNLTDKTFDPAYLAMWLKNPRIRPRTNPNSEMPDLGLSDREVAALTAFVNGGKAVSNK